MAEHIHSVRDCALPKVDTAEFYKRLRGGDLIFCSGKAPISRGIELITSSPFSHVLMVWTPNTWSKSWLTLEATIDRGCHIGNLRDYIGLYNGDLVLARRPVLGLFDIYSEINAGFEILDYSYDWQQEVSMVCHKLCEALPVITPKKEYFCSGMQYYLSTVTKYPLKKKGPGFPTPEDNFTDSTVVAECVLLDGGK